MAGNASRQPGRRRNGQGRGRRRQRNHDDAVLDLPPRASVPEHPLIPAADPELIVTDDALADLLAHIHEHGSVAYDTEFIGELSYHPRFCVIQLATPHRLAVVDAMLDLDLTPIWRLLADASVAKIVHAGMQDLEPVVRHLDQPPANVLDTQIAAGFCRLPYPVGLSKLVADLLDVSLGKGLTFTSWDERPLSAAHLHYAADDVRYLPALHAVLMERLEAMGHLDWVRQECEAMCDPAMYRFDAEVQAQRVRGNGGLTPRQHAVLVELVAWRDRGAREHDLPPRTFLKDEVLVDLARKPAKKLDHLDRVRGLPRPMIAGSGWQIIEAIQRGRERRTTRKAGTESISEEKPRDRFGLDSLFAAVQSYCHGRGIDPNLVATRRELARVHRAAGVAGTRLAESWRAEMIGDWLQAFLHDDRRLTLHWRDGDLHSHDNT